MSEYLNRVASAKKRTELLAILHTEYPAHFKRVFLAGFLRYAVGLTEKQVCEVIKAENRWRDYNPVVTLAQVRSIRPESESQRAIRKGTGSKSTKHEEPDTPFTPHLRPLHKGERAIAQGDWIAIMNPAGFTIEWIRIRRK